MTAVRKLQIENKAQPKAEWNRRILVVDDEPAVVTSYQDILTGSSQAKTTPRSSRNLSVTPLSISTPASGQSECRLTVAYSATEALTLVQQAIQKGQPFTMGFFDVMLGGSMDGIELVRQIHLLDPNLYAVFVTAYNDRKVESISGLLGSEQAANWDYLNKPFTHGEILQKARNGIAMWNLRTEKAQKEEYIANLQGQLIESEKLSLVAAVSRGVGHEFGNILTQIIGRAELSKNLPIEGMRDALGEILKASQKAAEVLNRFKNLSKSGHSQKQHQWFPLERPLNEAIDTLSHQLRTSSVKIVHLKTAKVEILGDQTALFQVFVNLIVNAIHAMPAAGQIDVTVEEVNGYAEARVRDYGTGVDPRILSRLTEAFFTTKGEKGTGLGLAICRDIVEIEHQGELKIRNHEIKGLEVIVRIPISNEEEGGSDG